jgi:hypothetical protein
MTRNWLADFGWERGRLVVKATGQRLDPLDRHLLAEVRDWFGYFFEVRRSLPPESGPTICFWPERARPWYLVWPAAMLAGAKIVSDPMMADVVFHFEDTTTHDGAAPATKPGAILVNFAARDITKSAVQAAHAAAFGHLLALDPARDAGPAVEKSEGNGVHDGRIATLPCVPRDGYVYQRLVDNRADDGLFEDLRTPTVGGVPIVVFIKRRPEALRFTNDNVTCPMKRPDEVFSAAEIDGIARFCAELGLDWGGIDLLRDRATGLLYAVDANKTDMGPPIACTMDDKMTATRLLADALARYLAARLSDRVA